MANNPYPSVVTAQPGMQQQPMVVQQQPMGVQQQPMMMQPQPMMMQTTVVVNQPGMGGWNSGICGCFEDLKSCCCIFFCGCFYMGAIAQRMGENCCVGCSGLPSGCVPGGHLAMRAAFRNRHGIPGSICDDCCMMTCCLLCAMCQLDREMTARGYGAGCC